MKSYDHTSYVIKAYFANQIEKNQKFNFLLAGMNLNGYLPANKVTKYRIVEYSEDEDIDFNLHVNSGNVELYGIVCEKFNKCLIKGNNINSFGKLIYNKLNRKKFDKIYKNP